MPKSLSTAEEILFKKQFLIDYQSTGGLFDNTFEKVTGIIGKEYRFPIVDQIQMTDRGPYHTQVPQTIPNFEEGVVLFENKATVVPTDIFEQAKVTPSARQIYTKLAANAMHRTEDQIRINALTNTPTINLIPANNENLTLEKIIKAKEDLDEENVPSTDRYFAATPSEASALLNLEKVTSSDYNTIKALVYGEINTFLGFEFKWVGKMVEGGIPFSSPGIRQCYAWHKSAMVAAWGDVGPDVNVWYENLLVSWLIMPRLIMGAKHQLPKGVVKIDCKEFTP